VPGGEASYTEAADINQNALDASEGLTGLPGSILQMTANPLDVINPANLPVNPATCTPIEPNQYLKVNTIFNVARQHGLRTAWSDKHPAYQILSGPSGTGVQDYFTPEIKIGGYDRSGTHHVGVPAIFGMNFQTVSTAQKLPTSDGLTGGYRPGGTVPGPLLVRAINAAWTAAHPGAGDLVVFSTDDDGMLLWLSDRSQAAADFVKNYLLTHPPAGNPVSGNLVTVPASGLRAVDARAASAAFFGVPASDPRHPDILGIAQRGVVYTGGTSKIAEHGGDDPQDRNVPVLVVLPRLPGGRTIGAPVETTQIAPTILALLGLNPDALQAVRIEHTQVLPGLRGAS
jgi:hypothetical protein